MLNGEIPMGRNYETVFICIKEKLHKTEKCSNMQDKKTLSRKNRLFINTVF